tara:strand:+ start:205 stop:4302 length:4098 start_codon:yes stop_codon:yes gene_type:complete
MSIRVENLVRTDEYYKDLREAGIKFLHRVNAEKEEQSSHDSFERILAPALVWATLTRQTVIEFYTMMYEKSKTGDNRKTWFNVAWLNAVEDRRENEKYNQHPRIMMEPFNDKNVSQEDRYKRLSKIISMAFGGMFFLEELQKIVKERNSLLDFVIEPDERKFVFRLKNITHVVDADALHSGSQQKLRDGIRQLVEDQKFETKVEHITKLTLLMKLILNIIKYEKEIENSLSLLSFIETEMTKFKAGLSDTSNLTRRKQIKERIDAMKWGPKEYQRDPKVIQEAQALLTRHGILTLQGVGAVGKTALANKLLLIAADEDLYDRYITQSTKVNSDQGELDFDSTGSNLITETTVQNSLYRSMLDPVSKKISGGMRRVCFDILQSIDPLYDSTTHKNEETESLIRKALEIMEKHSLLVCIDNFEDIESPAGEGMSPSLLSEVNQENKNFQSFFKQWANIYSSKTTAENQKRFSKIIITTRGKGEKTQVIPYPVPSLSKEENFNLFVSKLQSKVRSKLLDANTLTWVQENRTRINQLFDEWTLPVNKTKPGYEDYQFHPAYTLFAGGSVKATDGDFGVESQIKRWDPDGSAADQVREYVTSKIFGNVTKEQIDIFAALMRGGIEKTFDHRTIQDITQHDEEWKHDENWDWDKRNDFIREYSDNRDFFVETNLGGHYEWNRFYFKEIKKHFKKEYPDKNVEQDVNELDNEETSLQVREEKISMTERRDLEIWLSDDKLSNSIFKEENKTFNTVISKLKKEANLTEYNAASALIMLIGNDYIGAPDNLIQSLFTSECPNNNVFAKFRKPTDKIGKGSGGKNTPKNTLMTKFKNDNFHHVWDYFNIIRSEIETQLSPPKFQNITLKLQQILCLEAERCFENKLIELDDLLEFYKKSVETFISIRKEEKHYDDGHFGEIVTTIIHNYTEHLGVVPQNIYSDLSSNSHFNIHFETVLDFIDVLPSLQGKQMPLLGKFFWIALRYIATLENDLAIYDPDVESYLRKLHEYESYAAKESQNMNSDFIRRKKNRVLTNFKRVVWPIDNIDNVDILNGGLVGKLVYYNLGKSYNTKLNIEIRRGDINAASYLTDKEIKKLRNKTYPYTIAYASSSNIYLEPIVGLDGTISDNPEKLEDINQLKAKIVEDLIKYKIKNKNIRERWPEFSKRFDEWKCLPSLNQGGEMDQAKGLETLIQEHISEVNIHFFENRANEVYVKFSPFTQFEKDKVQRYKWEEKQYKEKETKLIWTNPAMDQISLPRNPKAYAELLDTLFIQIQEEQKYNYTLTKLESVADRKLIRVLLTRLFRIHGEKKTFFEAFENDPLDRSKFPTKLDLWNGLRPKYFAVATWMRHQKDNCKNITDILERYFTEAKKELSD